MLFDSETACKKLSKLCSQQAQWDCARLPFPSSQRMFRSGRSFFEMRNSARDRHSSLSLRVTCVHRSSPPAGVFPSRYVVQCLECCEHYCPGRLANVERRQLSETTHQMALLVVTLTRHHRRLESVIRGQLGMDGGVPARHFFAQRSAAKRLGGWGPRWRNVESKHAL